MTLKEIYDELDRLHGDIQEYIEEAYNGNLASDLSKDVESPLEVILVALDNIIDDERDGLYENDGESDFYEEEEDLW